MTWRPLPGGGDGPRRVGEGLDRLVRQYGMPSSELLDAIFQRWPDVVGPGLAAHCTPRRLDGTRLVVDAADAAWATQIRLMENDIVARINTHAPAVAAPPGDPPDGPISGLVVRVGRP